MKKNAKRFSAFILTLVSGSNWQGNVPTNVGTATGNAPTLNADYGVVTSAALTTAAGGTATITVANSFVKAKSVVSVAISGGTNTAGTPLIASAIPSAGSLVINIYNAHATAAFNGTLAVSFNVLDSE